MTSQSRRDCLAEDLPKIRAGMPEAADIDDDDLANLYRFFSEEVAAASWLEGPQTERFRRWATCSPLERVKRRQRAAREPDGASLDQIGEHSSCANPGECRCECLACKRAWDAAGRPSPPVGRSRDHHIEAAHLSPVDRERGILPQVRQGLVLIGLRSDEWSTVHGVMHTLGDQYQKFAVKEPKYRDRALNMAKELRRLQDEMLKQQHPERGGG